MNMTESLDHCRKPRPVQRVAKRRTRTVMVSPPFLLGFLLWQLFVIQTAVHKCQAFQAATPSPQQQRIHALPHVCPSRSIVVPWKRRAAATTIVLKSTTGTLFYNDFEGYNDNDDDSDEEDDEEEGNEDIIDADTLGDWRTFRRNLASIEMQAGGSSSAALDAASSSTLTQQQQQQDGSSSSSSQQQQQSQSNPITTAAAAATTTTGGGHGAGIVNKKLLPAKCRENEELLQQQSRELAQEYRAGAWAHETATPEVGGLVVRLPLEAEIYRNYLWSQVGMKFRETLSKELAMEEDTKNNDKADNDDDDEESKESSTSAIATLDNNNKNSKNKNDVENNGKKQTALARSLPPSVWFAKAQDMIEDAMLEIAETAGEDGQIDATRLNNYDSEILQLYLDNQESWQEVCLVLDLSGDGQGSSSGTATTLVLNRPMAMKLTDSLGRLVLHGAYVTPSLSRGVVVGNEMKMNPASAANRREADLSRFMRAFGQECAVYIGGPDDQDQPAELIHGIANLPGATEISPGTGIYRGGLEAAVDGVLVGKYKPLDFRFFVGRHVYEESMLDVAVRLGKYQPVACARAVALKQCLSLPKPLWHEVLELCGGDLKEMSQLELMKRDELQFQIIDDDEDDDEDDEDDIEYYDEDGNIEVIYELDELNQYDDEDSDDDDDDDSDDDDDDDEHEERDDGRRRYYSRR